MNTINGTEHCKCSILSRTYDHDRDAAEDYGSLTEPEKRAGGVVSFTQC